MEVPTILTDLFIIGLFALAVYAFSVLPRQRAFRERQKLVSKLKEGTEVITYGGLIGRVTKNQAEQGIVVLEVAPGVTMRFLVQSISSEYQPQAIAESAQKAMK